MRELSVLAVLLCFALPAAAQKAPAVKKAAQPAKKAAAVALSTAAPAVAVATAAPAAQPPAVNAAAERAKRTLANLEAWDAKLETLKADFTQEINFKEAGLKQSVEGTLQYSKPNLLRIEHTKPPAQLVVTDKTDIWIYKPADKQVVRTTWDAWRRTQDQNFSGILDFGNYSTLAAKNNAVVPEGEKDGLVTLVLTPRSGSSYELTLRLSAADYFPVEAELAVDSTVITTRLRKVEKNGAIAKEIFSFSPPKGAEVLEFKN
ncbi:MAG: outer membrane lipoprotein carrier protein LolA [Elusimicrobiota bacterium]